MAAIQHGEETSNVVFAGHGPRLDRATRAHLEAGIRVGEKMLVGMKHALNADIWVNRLPDELLLEIFKCYIAWRKKQLGDCNIVQAFRNRGHGTLAWVRITHVCHHWRQLALSCATFWSDIRLSRYSAAHAFLERSQQAPLSIHCRLLYSDATKRTKKYQLLQTMLAQASRIRALSLSYSNLEHNTRSRYPAEPDMGTCEFPELRSLSMTLESGNENTAPSFVARCPSFPRLQELRLQNYSLSLVETLAQKVPSLARLHLTGYNSEVMVDWNAVLTFLRSLPQLEELCLCDDVRHSQVAALGDPLNQSTLALNTIVTLPKLIFLRLACPIQSAPILLRHISHPANTKVRIDVDPPMGPLGGVEDGLAIFATALGLHITGQRVLGESEPFLSFSIDSPTETGVRVCMWTEALPTLSQAGDSSYSRGSDVYSRASIQLYFLYYTAATVFMNFTKALPLETIQCLFVGGYSAGELSYIPCEHTWRTAFAGATHVRELSVYANSGRHLPTALCPTVATACDGTQAWRVLFPRIDVLRMQHPDFTRGDAIRWKAAMPPAGWVVDLQGADGPRQVGLRMRLARLVVRKAVQIDVAHLNLLKQCLGAAAVEWDGVKKWRGRLPNQGRAAVLEYVNHDPGWVDDDI
ncbi:hypothetical protein PsYK624_099980 [Phanerochaete sordida]|uniref:F-box domain-containing protein n=1 Tax=Phanerochaete sordida TaxID=48140 RepID=A0A9P3LGP0_9APHY|nr:hypothetical protein PsYK624_099980 [Phanerochaete sordida]